MVEVGNFFLTFFSGVFSAFYYMEHLWSLPKMLKIYVTTAKNGISHLGIEVGDFLVSRPVPPSAV